MINLPKIEAVPTLDPSALLKKDKIDGKIDYAKIAQECFIDLKKPIPPQPVAISIGEMRNPAGEMVPIPMGSYGDYSCIVGLSKSKKTFFKSAVAACYIGGKSNNYFEDIKGHDTEGKYVIDLDTEQSPAHSQLTFKRIPDMTGGFPERYKPFVLRNKSVEERVGFIDWLIYESPYRGKIGLLLIDGIADLMYDFNNIEQSQVLVKKMLDWATFGKCHISGILHQNFGTSKPVGHLGSFVLKKAETVVFVERDADNKEITNVKCEYARNRSFEDFSFKVGSDWLPREISTIEDPDFF